MAVDFITMTQIVDHIYGILSASTDISDFLTVDNSYGSLTVYDNPNGFSPPSEAEAPFISIYRDKCTQGERVNEWIYKVELEIGLKDSATNTVGDKVEQTGLRKVEEFGNLVYAELRDNMNCNIEVSVADIEWDETSHPLYLAYYGLIIRVPQVIGAQINL